MLLERARDLTAKIAQYQKLKGAADESEQFHTRADQFARAAERIARVRQGLEKLSTAGVDVSFEPSDGAAYAVKAKTLRAALQANPAAINDPPFDLKHEFVDRLAGIATAADEAMREAWTAYVAKRAPFGSDDVLSALAVVPQFRASVAKIRRCRVDISALGNGLPADPGAAVARMDALLKEHDTAWAELSADDIPANVVDFIRAAAGAGAPLKGFTADVQAWLAERDLLTAFRIRLG
jgi:hypothetical protein